VIVDEVGVCKPSSRACRLAPGRMNALPGEVLYVCAGPWDPGGAISTVRGPAEAAKVLKQSGKDSDDRHAA
jgi:hypothetical protein